MGWLAQGSVLALAGPGSQVDVVAAVHVDVLQSSSVSRSSVVATRVSPVLLRQGIAASGRPCRQGRLGPQQAPAPARRA